MSVIIKGMGTNVITRGFGTSVVGKLIIEVLRITSRIATKLKLESKWRKIS